MGREIFSKAWAEKWASAGKDDLVKELDLAFEEPAKFAGNKEKEQNLHAWLPRAWHSRSAGKAIRRQSLEHGRSKQC
jgi:hypothetical protein